MTIHDTFYTDKFCEAMGFYKQDDSVNQVEFFQDSVPLKKGDKILDLGCGFGRHSIALAKKDYCVTGFDQSVDFIKRAKDEAKKAKVNAVFKVIDMRNIENVEEFDVVLSLSTSLAFYDEKSNTDIIRRIHRALKPKGKFLYDQGNIFWISSLSTNAEQKIQLSNGKYLYRALSFDPNTCVASSRSKIEGDGKHDESGWDLRYYSLPEIREIARNIGFEVIRTFGDYDGSDYSVQSNRMINVMRKL